jgi:hypothetical protein
MARDLVETTLTHLKKYNVDRIVLSPKLWKACKLPVSLNWSVVKYHKSQKSKLPKSQGVYTFVVKPGIVNHPECAYVMYVGKTEKQTFRERFSQYFIEEKNPKGREHIKIMAKFWKDNLWYCYAPVANVNLIDDIEDQLRNAFVPPYNREFRGTIGKARKAWS